MLLHPSLAEREVFDVFVKFAVGVGDKARAAQMIRMVEVEEVVSISWSAVICRRDRAAVVRVVNGVLAVHIPLGAPVIKTLAGEGCRCSCAARIDGTVCTRHHPAGYSAVAGKDVFGGYCTVSYHE